RVHDLTAQTISSLGGRVLRASIESQTDDKVFLGHVTIAASAGAVDLESRAADSVALALEAGAPIVVSRPLFGRLAVDPGELRQRQNAQKARTSRNAPPAPVYRI